MDLVGKDRAMKRIGVLVLAALLVGLLSVTATSAQDEDHAHLRIGHFAADAPNVDVWVNGERALEDFAPGSLSDFMDVEPGTVTVSVVPVGGSEAEAVVGPETVTADADHNYTLAVIGQSADDSLHALTVDETAAMADCDMSKSVFRILFNNIAGGPPVSFYENGDFVEKNIAYGEYAATCVPAFFWDTGKAVAGENLDDVLFEFDSEEDGSGGFWEPYTVYLWGLMGSYPGAPDEDYYFGGGNWYTVAPDPVTFLSGFSGLRLTGDSQVYFEFDTLVDLIHAAGLDDTLMNGGPYTLFAPTDQAFAALPDGTLDALRADPDALKALLLNHVIEGAPSGDDLMMMGTATTLAGNEVAIGAPMNDEDGHLYLNDDTRVALFNYPIANGSQVWFIDNLSLVMLEMEATPSA
jgi:hypothetical protein